MRAAVPFGVRGVVVAGLVCAVLAGCTSATSAGEKPPCSGDRTIFDGHAPGLHAALQEARTGHPFLVVDEETTDEWVPALDVDGLALPANWTGAYLGGLGWSVADPMPVEGGYRIADSRQGGFHLGQADGRTSIHGELPASWTLAQRTAALDGFLANVTRMDSAARMALSTGAAWDPEGMEGSAPSTAPGPPGRPGYVALQPVDLDEAPHLSPRLGHGAAWSEASESVGYRQVLVGGYVLDFYLPTLAGLWETDNMTIQLTVDAEDWARFAVHSQDHDQTRAERLRDATMASLGWRGEADWRLLHEDGTGALEGWMAACPDGS